MRRGMSRVAVMMGVLAFSALSAEASELNGPGDAAVYEVRVVNRYESSVRVYVEDESGRLHHLGFVSRGHFEVLEVSAEIVEKGNMLLRIYPTETDRSPVGNTDGIRTKKLSLEDSEAVTIWLKTDLSQSMIEIQKG
jgi:hypothetical protein